MATALPRAYLLLYNLLQFGGWAVALYQTGQHILRTGGLEGTYTAAGKVVGERQRVMVPPLACPASAWAAGNAPAA